MPASGKKGNKGGTGNPGYGYNETMKKLVGVCATEALDIMENQPDNPLRNEIITKIVVKAVPQNIDLSGKIEETHEFTFTQAEKELYVKLLLENTVTNVLERTGEDGDERKSVGLDITESDKE